MIYYMILGNQFICDVIGFRIVLMCIPVVFMICVRVCVSEIVEAI